MSHGCVAEDHGSLSGFALSSHLFSLYHLASTSLILFYKYSSDLSCTGRVFPRKLTSRGDSNSKSNSTCLRTVPFQIHLVHLFSQGSVWIYARNSVAKCTHYLVLSERFSQQAFLKCFCSSVAWTYIGYSIPYNHSWQSSSGQILGLNV